MTWDAFQREALAELGLRVYQLAPVEIVLPRGLSPALFAALQRAAGPGHAEVAALPGLATLQDATSKRALWPSLRRLRAAG